MRSFLNVLEADRRRFGDLRKVYALDAVAPGAEPDPRWTAVAVEPLAYVAPAAAGHPDHGALWRDLESLAELVERPRATSRTAAEAALRRNLADLMPLERERTLWLFESGERPWTERTRSPRVPATPSRCSSQMSLRSSGAPKSFVLHS